MIGRIRSRWETINESLWFVPSCCILVLIGFAFLMLELDERFDSFSAFPGDAGAARTVLQVVSGSLITVISLVFSITMLVLQQASQQYTPRLIGTFMGYRGVQMVLGVFLGTFLYSLLILRSIRESPNGTEYLPHLSISGAISLSGICIILLVYFIHHTAMSLGVPTVTNRVAQQLRDSIERHYPEIGEAIEGDDDLQAFVSRHAGGLTIEIRSNDSGFLRGVYEEGIIEAIDRAEWIAIRVRVGSYVHPGDLLMEIGGVEGLDDAGIGKLRGAFTFGIERSLHQDPLFGIRQLVDIALRALSPSLNDPTTAQYVLAQLGDILIALGGQPYVSRIRSVELEGGGRVEIWADRATFNDFVDSSFDQIRRAAVGDPHVTLHLLRVIESVGYNQSESWKLDSLRHQVAEVIDALAASDLRPSDREAVHAQALKSLDGMVSAYDRVAAKTHETHDDT